MQRFILENIVKKCVILEILEIAFLLSWATASC